MNDERVDMVECDQIIDMNEVSCDSHTDCFSCLSHSCVFTHGSCADHCSSPQCLHTTGSLQEASDLCRTSAEHFDQTADLLFTREGCACSDHCSMSRNGVCDDGGPDSVNSWCARGTDCSDCGPSDRKGNSCVDLPSGATHGSEEEESQADGSTSSDYAVRVCVCDDSCFFASDGECDDPGPGSVHVKNGQQSPCALGTDCSDCGMALRSKAMSAEVTDGGEPWLIVGHSCTAKPVSIYGKSADPTDETGMHSACLCDDSCNYRCPPALHGFTPLCTALCHSLFFSVGKMANVTTGVPVRLLRTVHSDLTVLTAVVVLGST
jgi:hypothetical protein